MLEYKLVPVEDMNHTITEKDSLLDNGEKTQNEEISLAENKPVSGGSDIKNYIFKILKDRTIKKSLKMKLLNNIMQKQDDKQEDELKTTALELQSEDSLFEIIKLNLNMSHIPEAYKFYLYLKKRSDITWDNQGVLIINGNKTHLDLFKFFKLLFASRTPIKDVNDILIIKRILNQASDMIQHVKNKHIKEILESDPIDSQLSSDSQDDSTNFFNAPYKTSLRSKKKNKGRGIQKIWEAW